MSKPVPFALHKKRGRPVAKINRAYHDDRTAGQDKILVAAEKYKRGHRLRFLGILDMVEVLKEMGWNNET